MALLNKRSRNIEGLLANRLTGGGTDRGTHGYNMGNKTFYDTKGQEGKNFLKAVDRYHNRDDWNKDLGGGQNFMQGPSSSGKDRILGMLPDSEALDDFATDKASERTSELDRQRLFADPENELDRNEMDSEALDEWHQDQASEKKEDEAHAMEAMADAYPQFEGDERAAKQKAFEEAVASDDDLGFAEPEAPGMWDKVKGLFASDEEGGGKKKKKMSKEAMKYGADLMQGMMQEPSQGQRQMPTSKVTRGSVPFAGLLAQKAPRQRNPYFTPKGLV